MVDSGPNPGERWPEGYRCALCVTIDVDGRYGEANYRPPDDMYWISQTAYDPRGTERLLQVLADRDTLATFCWVGRAAVDHPIHVRAATAAGHEIALHSWDHRPYNLMTRDEQRRDMEQSREALQRISGTTPVGHKTASWRYDEATHHVAQELGLLWVMDEPGGDLPFRIQPASSLPPLVQLPPSRWFDDYTVFVDHVLTPRHAFEMWRDDLDVLRDEGGMMCLTLHPFVSGRPGPSRTLAWLLDYAIDLGDVWIDRADRMAAWWMGQAAE
ncbi:MAG TPA: polysaccharide deacetylase family protein [Thermomicrobiales bacterium]|nr:polysaccharide deacetylase family protein [Thermomicrobiales bacterium]